MGRMAAVAALVLAMVAVAAAQTKQEVDLIVSGGIVVTMDGARTIFTTAASRLRATRLWPWERGRRSRGATRGETIDARGKLVLPGFINGHAHVPMTLFRGLHDDVTLHDWLYKYIFPAEAKNVNEEFVRWGRGLRRRSRSGRA